MMITKYQYLGLDLVMCAINQQRNAKISNANTLTLNLFKDIVSTI
jgi:hypothetical protein